MNTHFKLRYLRVLVRIPDIFRIYYEFNTGFWWTALNHCFSLQSFAVNLSLFDWYDSAFSRRARRITRRNAYEILMPWLGQLSQIKKRKSLEHHVQSRSKYQRYTTKGQAFVLAPELSSFRLQIDEPSFLVSRIWVGIHHLFLLFLFFLPRRVSLSFHPHPPSPRELPKRDLGPW